MTDNLEPTMPARGEGPPQPDERRTGAVTSPEDPPVFMSRQERFRDRRDAGLRLAASLERFREERPVVIGIPRGGVPVAAQVARALGAPLDVAVVRKIGAPQNPEFAIGALAEGGVHVLNDEVVRALGLSGERLRELIARAEAELAERRLRYRGAREATPLGGRTAILVDDGLATGQSARAAVASLRARGAGRVILAVPVAAPESADELRRQADEVVCVEEPAELWAIGYWYEDFRPTSDEEVAALLARYGEVPSGPDTAGRSRSPDGEPLPESSEVTIPLAPGLALSGDLAVPARARGIVVFAHGSGSSRLSPRNRSVAQALNEAGFATLLFDLLTPTEELDRNNVFDISLLAERLVAASAWLAEREEVAGLPLGYFGASTGAAAALTAAGELGELVGAVVSRGGRPDLAENLSAVTAPTLLIVGGSDRQVLELNREAQRQLRCVCELAVVPGASHLFEEPGALERVGSLAIEWLDGHLAPIEKPRRSGAFP
ncbi:MAG TPA: phosphoribosyltransferase family protein [Solirubrobacteraceae bacterium]|nr:phosphoribosyltransferase family protein [Solirubrobacteraceae bacterium]